MYSIHKCKQTLQSVKYFNKIISRLFDVMIGLREALVIANLSDQPTYTFFQIYRIDLIFGVWHD